MIDRIRKILDTMEEIGIGRFIFILLLGIGTGSAVTGIWFNKLEPGVQLGVLRAQLHELEITNGIRNQQVFALSTKLENISTVNTELRGAITILSDRLSSNKITPVPLPEAAQPQASPQSDKSPNIGPGLGSKSSQVNSLPAPATEQRIPGPRARAAELSRATTLRFGKMISLFNGEINFTA